jgi:hypothetical protein
MKTVYYTADGVTWNSIEITANGDDNMRQEIIDTIGLEDTTNFQWTKMPIDLGDN